MIKDFFIVLILFAAISCTKDSGPMPSPKHTSVNPDPNCTQYISSPVSSFTSPVTGTVNVSSNYSVVYSCVNSCGYFDSFIDSIVGQTRFVKLISKYSGCLCLQAQVTYSTQYSFQVSNPGTYYIRFWPYSTNVADTIIVN